MGSALLDPLERASAFSDIVICCGCCGFGCRRRKCLRRRLYNLALAWNIYVIYIPSMSTVFDWDDEKGDSNEEKHGVTFLEAATVFSDPLSLTVEDVDHSFEEWRFLTIGMSDRLRVLMVSHTEREDTIRIISAREATARERRNYEEMED